MFEYKVIPAPVTPIKRKGLKKIEDRFAATLTEAMNAAAAEGWEYVRADTLPCEERSGLTSKATKFHSLLVFRRPLAQAVTTQPAASRAPAVPDPTPGADETPPRPTLVVPTDAPKRGAVVLDAMRAIRSPKPADDDKAPENP